MSSAPSLFVSHGAPTLAIEDGAAHRFLKNWGSLSGKPSAIVVASAHWESDRARVTASAAPETIHDFFGFPAPLYEMRYPAPGDPGLAEQVVGLLNGAGIDADLDPDRGLDHGAWVPLRLMYPDADVPVVQLSIGLAGGPEYHLRLGAAIRPLRGRGIMILGSGSASHNLSELRRDDPGAAAPDWVSEFGEWVAAAIAAGHTRDLLDYRTTAPHAARNHPTEEHFLPLFVAMGAAATGERGQRLHTSHTYGALTMDAYAF